MFILGYADECMKQAYLGLALWMIVIVLIGFWPTYFGQVSRGDFGAQAMIHIHAAVFVGWIALFVWQALLIYQRKVSLHMRWGRIGFFYGIILLIVGLITGVVRNQYYLNQGMRDEAAFTHFVSIRDMAGFAVLFGLAMYYRKKPRLHKIWILGASVWLLIAAVARISINYFDNNPGWILLIWLFPVVVAGFYDAFKYRHFPSVHVALLVLMIVLSVVPLMLGGFI